MGRKEKHIYGEAGVPHLVFGIFCVVVAVILIVFGYAYLIGLEASGEGEIILKDILGVTAWNIGTLLFGVVGGFEIGRYVQTEFAKRRKHTPMI